MDAMILAAGKGTRLRPLTLAIPKALVPVAGVPMLERVARRLVEAGADRLVVNVSPHADQVRAFVAVQGGFGAEVLFSQEPPEPLETGGGLRHAEPLFRKGEPFLMHNVDILTDADLRGLLEAHRRSGALASLLVRAPRTGRHLLFDREGLLGYALRGEEKRVREAAGDVEPLDFMGVQALSPRIFELTVETGAFSILDVYLRLARDGERTLPHWAGDALWIDVGTPDGLAQAERALGPGREVS